MTPVLPRRVQRGQSLAEFLVAMTVLAPIFVAISYAGKYSDIQLTATQASRYAAMQRAMEPDAGRLSQSKLQDQTRVRFFIDSMQLNSGRIQSDDSAAPITADDKQAANWRDQKYGALLSDLNQVSVTNTTPPMGGSSYLAPANVFVHKDYGLAYQSKVEVTLVNKMDLLNDTPSPIKIAAATASIGGDNWSTPSSAKTLDVVKPLVPSHYLAPVAFIADLFTLTFEGPGHDFEFGCIKPDEVPANRLSSAVSPQACP